LPGKYSNTGVLSALPGARSAARRPHRRQVDAGDDAVADGADALDGHLDDVAGPQRGRVLAPAAAPQLGEAAAVAAGARAEHVARADPGAARGVADQLLERPPHVGQQVAADLDAADGDAHLQREEPVRVAEGLELVRGDQPRPEGGGGVLALGRAELDLHLAALQVARRPV